MASTPFSPAGRRVKEASRASTPGASAMSGLTEPAAISGQSTAICDNRTSASATAARFAGGRSRKPASSLPARDRPMSCDAKARFSGGRS